jgi:acyl dehydratase
VGDAHEGTPMPVEMRDVAVFAALTGDHHPIHTDVEWATEHGPFGRPIAHGLLVLALAVGGLPLDPGRVLALRRLREATFKRPVAVGEEITVRCRVTGLEKVDARTGIVVCEWRISGPDGRLRARALVEILWRRGELKPAELDALDPVRVEPDGAVQVLI